MSTQNPIDVKAVLDRAKLALGLKTDTELAKRLGIKPNTVATWRSRGSIDLNTVFANCKDISADWLLFGRGEMKAGPGDDLTRKIIGMLEGMDEEGKRDVLRYTQKAELIEELMRERKKA